MKQFATITITYTESNNTPSQVTRQGVIAGKNAKDIYTKILTMVCKEQNVTFDKISVVNYFACKNEE